MRVANLHGKYGVRWRRNGMGCIISQQDSIHTRQRGGGVAMVRLFYRVAVTNHS